YREGGWLLGCAFVSDLGDEEVSYILEFDPRRRVASAQSFAEGHETPSINGVLFQAKIQAGEYLRWYVKRLDLSAAWPLGVNKYVLLSVGGLAGAPPVQLKIKDCRPFGSYWIVDC